jgi:hypothetical protein
MAVLPSVTAVLLHHSAMDIWTDCRVVSDRVEEKWRFCLQLLQYCYITVLRMCGLRAGLLVQGGREMAFLPAVTAVLLHHSAMDMWTESRVVSTGWKGNGGSACSYCITVLSHCYGYVVD